MKEIGVYQNLRSFSYDINLNYIMKIILFVLRGNLYKEIITAIYFTNLLIVSKQRYDFLGYDNYNASDYFGEYVNTNSYKNFITLYEITFATNKNTDFLKEFIWTLKTLFHNKLTLMSGETSIVFIDIWEKYLLKKGAMIMRSTELESIKFNDNKIDHIITSSGLKISGDEFIMAITNDDWKKILNKNILTKVPSLSSAFIVPRVWQNSVTIYLNRLIEVTDTRNALYNFIGTNITNPWNVTWQIYNKYTWTSDIDNYFNQNSIPITIVSVVISNWKTIGNYNKKTTMQCSPNEIINEVIQQLIYMNVLNATDVICLNNHNIKWDKNDLNNVYGIIDKAIVFDNVNSLPIINNNTLVATNKDSFKFLPKPMTNIENMYLASTWISKPGFSTCEYMEGACVSGINATNCLLEKYNDEYPLLILGKNIQFINPIEDNPIGYFIERLNYLLEIFDRIFLYPLAFILKYFNLI